MKACIIYLPVFFIAACGSSSFEAQSQGQYQAEDEPSPLSFRGGVSSAGSQSLHYAYNAGVINQVVRVGGSNYDAYDEAFVPANVPVVRAQTITEPLGENAAAQPRLVSYSGQLRMRVDSLNYVLQQIKKHSANFGGFVVNSNNRMINIRVISSHFEDVMSRIAELGTVEDRRVEGRDISDEFYDLETRLSNSESARKRYLELLAKSENVEAGLKVERELERLNGEIETMKARRERMKEMHQMAFISVSLRETNPQNQTKPGPVGYVFVGLYHAIKWLFVWD